MIRKKIKLIAITALILLYNGYKVNAEPVQMAIDAPSNDEVINKDINISGWAINTSGLKQVEIFDSNGNLIGQVGANVIRDDVKRVYNTYETARNSGYSTNISLDKFKEGINILKVKATGNDGTFQEKSVKVIRQESIINLEVPQNGSTVNENVKIEGWALNGSGLKEVQILDQNGNLLGKASGVLRNDVKAVYSDYKNAENSGFRYVLQNSVLKAGNNSIQIRAIGNDGSYKDTTLNLQKEYDNLKPQINVETLNDGEVFTNQNIFVEGWAINESGLKNIQIFVDGTLKSDTTPNISRTDVKNAYPNYQNSENSGFRVTIDKNSIGIGKHKVRIVAIGNNGSTQEKTMNVYVSKLNPIMNLETLSSGQVLENSVNVSGWSLNASGTKIVEILLDGRKIADVGTTGSRQDVYNAYTNYNQLNSGFSKTIDLSSIDSGKHTITVTCIGNDGDRVSRSVAVNNKRVENSDFNGKMNIESPQSDSHQKGVVRVSGWAIAPDGVSDVSIYVDGKYVVSAQYGLQRNDVFNAYSSYKDSANSGFISDINLNNFEQGNRRITVVVKDVNGNVYSKDVTIFNTVNIMFTNYNSTLSQAVDKQMQYGGPVKDVNWQWVAASRSDVEYYANPKNFMDSYGIYQFLRLDFQEGITVSDLNNLLQGKGVLENKGEVFLNAARRSNINPIYLVAHALLETGNGRSRLSTGIVVNGRNVYNIFGIHAFDRDPNGFGSQYAYEKGWFSVDEAIMGGAEWISGQYINNSGYKQNTLYKMRWNPSNPTQHQYATDVKWAHNQIYNIKKLMDKCSNPTLVFDVPIYK